MKQRQRPASRLPAFLTAFTAVALAVLLIALLPPFRAGEIEISDTRAMTRDEILKTSGLVTGQHLLQGIGGSIPQIFQLRYGEAEAALIRTYPYIRSVTAQLEFPGKIRITIDERIEVSYLSIPEGCVLVDKDGYALRVVSTPPAAIPVIEGIMVRQMRTGSEITVDLPESMNHALSLMGAIIDADKDTRSTTRLLPMVKKIRPVSSRDVYLTLILPKTGEELNVLTRVSTTIGEDMVWLRFAILQGALDGRGKGVLDMSGDTKVFIPDKA